MLSGTYTYISVNNVMMLISISLNFSSDELDMILCKTLSVSRVVFRYSRCNHYHPELLQRHVSSEGAEGDVIHS